MSSKIDARQSILRSAQGMIGSNANDSLDTIFPKINDEIAKLFEDRNIQLVDGGIITVNSTATTISFSSSLKLHINSLVSGGSPVIIDLTAASRTVSADGRMVYAVINRSAGTATVIDDAATLPATTSSNQEVFLIAKRIGTTIYFRNGFAISANNSSTLKSQSSEYLQSTISTDSSSTGSNVTIAAVSGSIVRLTNASLVSVSGIPATAFPKLLILENKTGSAVTINNEEGTALASDRIVTGTSGNVALANNAALFLVYDTSSSRWQVVGGTGSGNGGGTAGINYFSDRDAANIANFVLYSDGGATPTDGVGGTPNITKSLNTSTPLIGVTSYRMSKDAVNRQGQGFSITTDIPLDAPVTAGEPITVQFRYRTSANYATGDVRMFVYFVGPNTLQALNGVSNTGEFGNNLVKSFDDRSQFTASTSCPAGTTAIRVIGHIATTSTSAYDIDVDEITIGTAATLTAPIVTDWVSYNPDVFDGNINRNSEFTSRIGRWKRIGDQIQVDIQLRRNGSTSSGAGGQFMVSLPEGLTRANVGPSQTTGIYFTNQDSNFQGSIYIPPSSNRLEIMTSYETGVRLYNNTNLPANSWHGIGVTIPITQFTSGSNVISSTQANFLSGAFRASRNGTDQTGVNPNDSFVKININSVSASTDYVRGGFSYDTANSRFVAHKKLKLNVSARIQVNPTNTAVNAVYMAAIRKNGSVNIINGQFYRSPISSAAVSVSCSGSIELNAGDFIELMLYSNADHSVNQLTVSGPATSTYFEATEIPDLSVVGISGAPLEILHTISSQKTPAGTGQWHAHTGNSLTLAPGVWRVSARGGFFNNGSSAGYTRVRIQIGSSNGGDSGTEPPASGPNFEVLDGNVATNLTTSIPLPGGSEDIILPAPQKIVSVVSTQTFFANSLAAMATPANSRIIVSLTAERIR